MIIYAFLLLLPVCISETSLKQRFPVYWNIPDRCTKRWRNETDYFSVLDEFNILRNSNGDVWGNKITIIYSRHFEHYPHLKIDPITRNVTEVVDGGIPQRTNFSTFFKSAEELIQRVIPDPAFDGPAILDFEEYRFLYQYNWGPRIAYRKFSDKHTALKYPNMSVKAVKARSEVEFNNAARRTILGVLRIGKRLRPYAKWGYYLMPECSGHYDSSNVQCTDLYAMKMLFNEQTGMYPSVYFETDKALNYRATQVRMREARRFSLRNRGRLPIFAYTKIEYNAYKNATWFYSKADLCAAFQGAFEEGANGMIIWGADRQPWDVRCPAIRHYIETTLGPVVQNMQNKAEKCSKKKCSGHGNCLRVGDLLLDCKWNMKEKLKTMVCLCDDGYFGPHCEYHERRAYQPKDRQKLRIPNKLKKKKKLLLTTTTDASIETTSVAPETTSIQIDDALQSIALLPPPF